MLRPQHARKTYFWRFVCSSVLLMMMGIIFSAHMTSVSAQTAPPQSTVYAAYQTYENGFMIWRSDNNAIYVFYYGSGYAEFPQGLYGSLPDNPITEQPPNNRIRPIRGFGRVWGNFSDVRDRLGWATTPEAGYDATFYTLPDTLFINTPDGTFLSLNANNWTIVYGNPFPGATLTPVAPQPTATTIPPPSQIMSPATYQYYQGGLMTWWSHNSTIMVFANTGQVLSYPVAQYGGLAENTWVYPPAGYVRPIMGFGKVWANNAYVNRLLGWATTFERAFTAEIVLDDIAEDNVNFSMRAPNGNIIIVTEQGTWYYI